MTPSKNGSSAEDFHLDIFGQQQRINKLYTQITYCFPTGNEDRVEIIIETLKSGAERLFEAIPWIAGTVIEEEGTFKIKPFERTEPLIVKDLRSDTQVPSWGSFENARFPFSMLDEKDIAPSTTLSDDTVSDFPVFLIQANLVVGGLLLTFNGQHGSMDMAGLGEVIRLYSKVCRNESFTAEELEVSNMDRKGIIPLLDDDEYKASNGQIQPPQPATTDDKPSSSKSVSDSLIWSYISFSASSLKAMKSDATSNLPENTSFVSTDDVLSAFIWQRMTTSRLFRLETSNLQLNLTSQSQSSTTSLSRNVDVRTHFNLPPSYPGLLVTSTTHTLPVENLIYQSLSNLSSTLRVSLNPDLIRHQVRIQVSIALNKPPPSFASSSNPALDVRLSSWAKERCYEHDFGPGLGKPTVVRRPRFERGAREGLVYFLPKTRDGEIVVGVCLREDDMERLRSDGEIRRWGRWIG
ncbi:trichothecene 3-O-acetyltransferase [Aulographum hederae CBS 113979]|uniref:Trichothecene 3-O-acetyltransferase n=1 Tax=Aulographum hederae CBS 113979 TaxID=1176131 RepID=A0A6G1GXX1_9PEZI|nr:trichothecene 3-O-acetyltransferase [Aulographum hederae CBS 113979]